MKKLLAMIAAALMITAGVALAVEWYDPIPDLPGKFMGPHGPQHAEWHYHGPPANKEAHCSAVEEGREDVLEACDNHH